jgi:hypothetical protein
MLASLSLSVDRQDNMPRILPVQHSGEVLTRDTVYEGFRPMLPICQNYYPEHSPGCRPIDVIYQSLGSAAYEIHIRLHIQCQLRLSWPM